MPRTWQLWRPFAGIHRWYFSPGCPPPLRNLTGWMGHIHCMVLCAAMGLVAGLIGVVVIVATNFVPQNGPIAQVILLGLIYGVVVIYPLSRWIHRSVFWSLSGIVFCVLCYFALLPMSGFWSNYMYLMSARPMTPLLRFLYTILVFAPSVLVLGLFMRGGQRRISWILPGVFLAVLVFAGSLELINATRWYFLPALRGNQLMTMIIAAQPVLLSWMFLAVVLGMRLWPSMRDHELPTV